MNPFYLVSAASMLGGCYLLSGAASKETEGLSHVLGVLAWLTVYELLLSGLAAFLGRRGLTRDSRSLLVLAAVFLTDATHLTAETVTWSGRAWAGAALLLLGLGLAKIGLVLRLFGVRLEPRALLPPGALLAALIFMPGVFQELTRRAVALDLPLYGAAWVVGFVLVLRSLRERAESAATAVEPPPPTVFLSTLGVALPVSFAAHVLSSYWMYDVTFRMCSLTPPLLALAVAVARVPDGRDYLRLRIGLPALAVLFSLGAPSELVFGGGVMFSPMRAALVVAAAVYLADYSRHRQLVFVPLATACAFLALAGHSPSAAWDNLAQIDRFLPQTRKHWGALAMAVSYVVLGVGAWLSLRGQRARRVMP